MKHHRGIVLSIPRLLVGLLVVGAFGLIGSHRLGGSFAATSGNPYGIMDSCVLSGSTTIIYGWAVDPQLSTPTSTPTVTVKASSQSESVPTGSNYRTNAITGYIHHYHSGDPTPGEYGFTAQFSGLYKGNSYAVSGTITNVGAGANTAIVVNQTTVYDGISHNVFTGGKIPNVCLATVPASPPSPPPPSSGGGSGSSGTTKKPSAPATPAPATTPADATVTAGTAVVVIKIPADGAAKVHLNYGITDGPTVSTDDETANGDGATVTLDSLSPKTGYSFQIVRTTSGGATATSSATAFTTAGFTAKLTFQTGNKKPVKGIAGSINDAKHTKATSDKKGTMIFTDLDENIYMITYSYHGKTYTETLDTSTGLANAKPTPDVITLSDTINVDQLGTSKSPGSVGAQGGGAGVVVWLLLLLIGGAGGWFGWRWWRQKQLSQEYAALENPAATEVDDAQALHDLSKQPPPEPMQAHTGESLRDMVIQSMYQQQHSQEPAPHEPAQALPPQPAPQAPASLGPKPVPSTLQPPSSQPTEPSANSSGEDDEHTIQISH